MEFLEAKVNLYNSVEIIDGRIAADADLSVVKGASADLLIISELLNASLEQWEKAGHVGVYLDLPKSAAHIIPIAISFGFDFHHAHEEYLMLLKKFENHDVGFPPGPCHFVGVGGMVVRPIDDPASKKFDDYEILVIKEKHGPSTKIPDFWKIPGGLVDMNEHLSDAVVREVFEETGIEAVFGKVGGVRENHNGTHSMTRKNSTDMYVVCTLTLKDEDKRDIKIQESEIAQAQWMNLGEFFKTSIYKNKRDPFAKLMRNAAEVAVGLRAGLEFSVSGRGNRKQINYLSAKL